MTQPVSESTLAVPGADARPPGPRAHGGQLVQRWASPDEADRVLEDWGRTPRLRLGPHQLSDAVLIANGAFSPLTGFQGSRD